VGQFGQPEVEPAAVLDGRLVKEEEENDPITQLLIRLFTIECYMRRLFTIEAAIRGLCS
jgi:hypothetical protein